MVTMSQEIYYIELDYKTMVWPAYQVEDQTLLLKIQHLSILLQIQEFENVHAYFPIHCKPYKMQQYFTKLVAAST